MNLNSNDKAMLAGDNGQGCQMAMRIVVRVAEGCGIDELINVTAAHIDACGLLSNSSLQFAETLAKAGAKVSIPTTLSMGPLDLQNWDEFGIDPEYAAKAIRQADAYIAMGCIPAWTCAPYQSYLTPRFGQQIAWGESNAVAYANSVLGARTERYADFMDICAAITGRAPKSGLHIQKNRKGQILFVLNGIDSGDMRSDDFYSVLGFLIGTRTGAKIPVIKGLYKNATSDNLKALGAAAASSGSVSLFHAVGITPEAKTVEQAFHGDEPEQAIEISPSDIEQARKDLSTCEPKEKVDMVVLGCPHFSYDEFCELARHIQQQGSVKVSDDVDFIVKSSRASYALIQNTEMLTLFEEFGIKITLDTCVFHTPIVGDNIKTLMTNSGKCAYYAPGELGVKVAFGTMEQCVRSAVKGYVC
jgi:predicted aconitase